jgi:hypothetical protein
VITKEQAVNLRRGQVLYSTTRRASDGTPLKVRVNGKCVVWKTRPNEFRLPVKSGLRGYGFLDESNASEWALVPRSNPQEQMEEFVNSFLRTVGDSSFDHKMFAELMCAQHRTRQQDGFRAVLAFIVELSRQEYDLRNEVAVRTAIAMTMAGQNDDPKIVVNHRHVPRI